MHDSNRQEKAVIAAGSTLLLFVSIPLVGSSTPQMSENGRGSERSC